MLDHHRHASVLPAGRCWSAFSGIFGSSLSSLTKKTLSEFPLWHNVLDPRMTVNVLVLPFNCRHKAVKIQKNVYVYSYHLLWFNLHILIQCNRAVGPKLAILILNWQWLWWILTVLKSSLTKFVILILNLTMIIMNTDSVIEQSDQGSPFWCLIWQCLWWIR